MLTSAYTYYTLKVFLSFFFAFQLCPYQKHAPLFYFCEAVQWIYFALLGKFYSHFIHRRKFNLRYFVFLSPAHCCWFRHFSSANEKRFFTHRTCQTKLPKLTSCLFQYHTFSFVLLGLRQKYPVYFLFLLVLPFFTLNFEFCLFPLLFTFASLF